MPTEKLTVSGKIISELSEKIPTNIIALNELIKNSYDAGADEVNIYLDTKRKTLIIKDDGTGFDLPGIKRLFHIADSEKKYGSIGLKNRYVQGSKGLGFLSVFKFGQGLVTWETKREKGYNFSVQYDDLIKVYNISDFPVDIDEKDSIEKGTKITIMLDDYNIVSLQSFFEDDKNSLKVLYSFYKNDIIINIYIDEKTYTNSEIVIESDMLPSRQLYRITYDSNSKYIKFNHNNHVLAKTFFPYSIDNSSINIDLIVFSLNSHQKKLVSKLYWDNQDDLRPLIFVNDNIFNNTNLFDPNINIKVKTGEVLNQIIGKINIISNDSNVSFNSDRTHFTQNYYTDSIAIFLLQFNKLIQSEGSKMKAHLIKNDYVDEEKLCEFGAGITEDDAISCIKSTFFFKECVQINISEGEISFNFLDKISVFQINNFEKTNDDFLREATLTSAKIILSTKSLEHPIDGSQINLYDFIVQISNSKNVVVSKNDVEMWIDGVKNINHIIPSVPEIQVMNVEFRYEDSFTGRTSQTLEISFYEPQRTFKVIPLMSRPLKYPAYDGYEISISVSMNELISQYNDLCQLGGSNNYNAVKACCLRVLFELGIFSLTELGKDRAKYHPNENLLAKVKKVVYFAHSKEVISKISDNTKIKIETWQSILLSDAIARAVKDSNFGSHGSTRFLSDERICEIQLQAANFVVIINELINNVDIP